MRLPDVIDEPVACRLALIMPDSATVLAQSAHGDRTLPIIEISPWTRSATQVQRTIRDNWGLAGFVLNVFPDSAERTSWAVVEILTAERATSLEAVPPSRLDAAQLDASEAGQLNRLLCGESAGGPFARLGWIDEAIQWLETVSGRTLSSRADIEQLNAGGHFALLRFPTTDGGGYWLKATGEPNTHELCVATTLSALCAKHVPEVIATRPAWNAWITSAKASPLWELPKDAGRLLPVLKRAALAMAELQIATIGKRSELSAAGAFDQSVEHLRTDSDEMFLFLAEAMRQQKSTKVLPLTTKRLDELHSILNKCCDRIRDLGIPDTIVHGDLNRGNILVDGERCQFIDWAEAYIGFPFSNLEHLLLLNKIETHSERETVNRHVRERYREAWSAVCEPARIEEALRLAPVLAIASALYGRGDWLRSSSRLLPERQSYARTLARCMDRAASAPEFLEALCME